VRRDNADDGRIFGAGHRQVTSKKEQDVTWCNLDMAKPQIACCA